MNNVNTKNDTISRQAAIDALTDENIINHMDSVNDGDLHRCKRAMERILTQLPSAQPEKEIPKRVLWSGWKGYRNTRYKCQACNNPVKNDDVYCHRCGQKLMFPKISHTPYVPGEKQELIVRWDDEE